MTSKRSKDYPTSPQSYLWKVKIQTLCPSGDLYSPHLTFQFTSDVQKIRPIRKIGGRKPSIVGTVRLLHRKLNIVKELKQELEYQIHSGLEPEVVSVTHDEFKRTMSLDELVDQLTQSENVDAEDSLNDAACLSKLKVEVAQTVQKHELSFRNTSTRPSSAASSRSNRIPVPSAPESPGVVQSMQDTRQQKVNNLADQQATSNPITIHRQVQSAMGVLQDNFNGAISSRVQNSLQPSALEQTDSDNVASNQHQPLQPIEPIVNPTVVTQSSIGATCVFPQLSTASNTQLPVFSGTLPPAEILSPLTGPLITPASLKMYMIIGRLFQFLSAILSQRQAILAHFRHIAQTVGQT